MGLKAPGILVFLVSMIVALAALFARFFGAEIPLMSNIAAQFFGLLAAYFILVLGCLVRVL